MAAQSVHLDEIIRRHNQTANLQVVFIDVVKYSKRRTVMQIAIIEALTSCMRIALQESGKEYLSYAQENNLNYQNDIIALPTGDGAAVVFSFDGLHDIHLFFAKMLLRVVHEHNLAHPCEKFAEQGWCNCHPNFSVRVGISEGKGIVYRDVNDSYNVAGGVINTASRVMGQVDGAQIAFTEDAYRQLIDMVDDPELADRFVEFNDVPIKHGLEINLFQYLGNGEPYINSDSPEDLMLRTRLKRVQDIMMSQGPMFNPGNMNAGPEKLLEIMEGFATLLTGLGSAPKQVPIEYLEPEAEV